MTESLIFNLVPELTPWGKRHSEFEIFSGFVSVETPRHGGVWLSEQQRAQIPVYLKRLSVGKEGIWWEEDCAWSIPILYFLTRKPKLFDDEEALLYERAIETASEWYPSAYKKIMRTAPHRHPLPS